MSAVLTAWFVVYFGSVVVLVAVGAWDVLTGQYQEKAPAAARIPVQRTRVGADR
jgi:hypothetical protein